MEISHFRSDLADCYGQLLDLGRGQGGVDVRVNEEELAEAGDFEDRLDRGLHAGEHEFAAVRFDALRAVDQHGETRCM